MNGLKHNEGDRKLYYISAEFLVGKLLSNNLINLGVFEEVREVLKKHGHDLTEIEEVELEPSVILSIISSSLFPYNCDFAVHNLFIYHSKFFHFINIVSSFLLTIL